MQVRIHPDVGILEQIEALRKGFEDAPLGIGLQLVYRKYHRLLARQALRPSAGAVAPNDGAQWRGIGRVFLVVNAGDT